MYTIYESIGKSVVVPYCGSKTINVRLTVSPDTKTTESKVTKPTGSLFQRRYKYKSRKLIPTDEEDAPTQPTSQEINPSVDVVDGFSQPFIAHKSTDLQQQPRVCSSNEKPITAALDNRNSTSSTPCKTPTTIIRNNCTEGAADNLYESINKSSTPAKRPSSAAVAAMQRLEEAQLEMANYSCRECSSQCPLLDQSVAAAPTKSRKLMRKSRSKKQKTQISSQARVRSLSVGNENCYQMAAASANVAAANVAQLIEGGEEECLNNLRRNDLIDIIRESMEKNRLCFQSNG